MMATRQQTNHTLVVMLTLLISACAATPQTVVWPDIEGGRIPEANRMISGQPTPAELADAKTGGVRHVVNARDIGEFSAWDEGALVSSLGMSYHRVPIGGPDDLDREAVAMFDQILAEIGDEPALLHCASGNRIGALYALRAAWLQGEDTESAIAIGKTHGLTSLEASVRKRLDGERP